MARVIIHKEQGPQQVGDQWICRCGLSKNQPFCDGSHAKTEDEEEGKLYRYDEQGQRYEVEIKELD